MIIVRRGEPTALSAPSIHHIIKIGTWLRSAGFITRQFGAARFWVLELDSAVKLGLISGGVRVTFERMFERRLG